MSSLANWAGPKRVVVDRVVPFLDDGSFPVKRIIGDRVAFGAHVFADSHDALLVTLRIRRVGQKRWLEMAMGPTGNDEWGVNFDPTEIGLFEYEIAGVVDHFGSWYEGFVKKLEGGVSIDVELLTGAQLLAEAGKRADGAIARRLQEAASFVGEAKRDLTQRIQVVRDNSLVSLARAFPQRELETCSPKGLLMVERERAIFSTWYEFFPRSCANDGVTHGTFADAADRLPEISRMGFDVVYFPPIHPIGRTFRKGRNNSLSPEPDDVGSPWAIGAAEGGHCSILPALGSLEDFKTFLAQAAEFRLEVALDIAFQCAPDHPWVKEHPEWFRWRPDGTVQDAENPPKKYQDILPINFESSDWRGLWAELKAVFEYWIAVGVKIFRVDNPHTKSMEFWRWCILEIKQAHPEVLFLAEAFTRPKRKYRLAKAGFTQGYTYFTWRNQPAEMQAYVEELTQTAVRDYFFPNFWPNTPDILHEDLQLGNRATFIGRYVLAATLVSNTGIYGPAYELLDKEPFPGKEEYNNNEKYQLKVWDWDEPGNIKDEIARVNRIRNENPAFQRTQNIAFIPTDNPNLLVYMKQNFDRSNQFIVVVNMDWEATQSGFVEVPVAALGMGSDAAYTVRDLLDPRETAHQWRGSRNFVKLDPLISPAHIFRVEF